MPVLSSANDELFCRHKAVGMDTGLAWEGSGHKTTGESARAGGRRKMAKKYIQDRIAELIEPSIKAVELSVESVLKEMMCLAYYDMTAILESKDGKVTLRDPRTLPEDLRRAIVAIKPVQIGEETLYTCKFADKKGSLESLARYLQMFKDTVIVENVYRIVSEMGDDELDRRLRELERAYRNATTLDPAAGEGSESVH